MSDIKKIEEIAKTYFKGSSGCHDWTHVERVRAMCLHIGEKEGANLKILEISALLHDIGRKNEMKSKGSFCHAEKGAELGKDILKKFNYDKSTCDNIIQCIIAHRFRNSHVPETIEAKCLFDADKLDSIGAIGIARVFLFAGHSGSNTIYTGNEKKLAKSSINYSYTKEDSAILEWEVKLKFIKDKMLTATGKEMAKGRHKYIEEFFETFWKEVEGEI